ncbi:unnamed protein product [Paramecium sonneborni]|uniref:Uncharacterized protein n=1 Tax=Paramecium sonneborni TaxID=65129 RepID=A0A8S1N8A3_9CILI|nr:unnamed protein product [Paramecium sonneborni]
MLNKLIKNLLNNNKIQMLILLNNKNWIKSNQLEMELFSISKKIFKLFSITIKKNQTKLISQNYMYTNLEINMHQSCIHSHQWMVRCCYANLLRIIQMIIVVLKEEEQIHIKRVVHNQIVKDYIFKSITIQDCEIVTKIINKCDALAVLNILPQDLESFLPLSNGHYSIVLRQHAELNKVNKKLFKFLNEKKVQVNYKQLMPIEEFILDQRSQCYEVQREIFKLKSLDIQHYFAFPSQILTAESVMDIILKILSIILDNDQTAALKMGFNLLISKHIIFLCPTYSNYDNIDGFKLHLQAFTAMGFLNLPTGSSSINFFDLLQKAQEKVQQ